MNGEALQSIHRGMINAQLDTIRVLERMDPADVQAMFGDELAQQAEEARSSLPDLRPWPELPARSWDVYDEAPTQARFHRTTQLLDRDDRVVDIGVSYGLLSGVLLKTVRPRYYCGVDVAGHLLDSAHRMMETNDIGGDGVEFRQLSIYDLDRELTSEIGPTVVTVFEVLEHLPDAEHALETVARAVEPETAIFFTVPLLGRLEHVWGHTSVFDVDRIDRMCRRSGLTIQHAEALHNRWVLVMASRSPKAHSRVAAIQHSQGALSGDSQARTYEFERVDLDGTHLRTPQGPLQPSRTRAGVETVIGSSEHRALVIPVEHAEMVRLRFSLAEPEQVARGLRIEAFDEDDRRVAVWRRPTTRDVAPDAKLTAVLRPGRPATKFVPEGRVLSGSMERLELSVDGRGSPEANLVVHRVEFVRGEFERRRSLSASSADRVATVPLSPRTKELVRRLAPPGSRRRSAARRVLGRWTR